MVEPGCKKKGRFLLRAVPVRLENGVKRVMRRRWNAALFTESPDRTGHPFQLRRLVSVQIVIHRRHHGPGNSAIRFSCCSIAFSGKSTPIARPTAIDSSSDATITGWISGSSRIRHGFRVDVVMLDIVAISKNFIQTSDSTLDEYVGLRPALSAASFSRCPRSDIVPSCSPKAKRQRYLSAGSNRALR